MNIKKEANYDILTVLKEKYNALDSEQRRNTRYINDISNKQRIIKKEKHKISQLINQLNKDIPCDKR